MDIDEVPEMAYSLTYIVDEKSVDTTVSILKGVHEDKSIGDCSGMDHGRDRAVLHQAGDQVTDQVGALIAVIGTGELGSNDLMKTLGLSHRPTFRENYLNPALADSWIDRTQPDAPRSPTQRYRLTARGHRWLRQHEKE